MRTIAAAACSRVAAGETGSDHSRFSRNETSPAIVDCCAQGRHRVGTGQRAICGPRVFLSERGVWCSCRSGAPAIARKPRRIGVGDDFGLTGNKIENGVVMGKLDGKVAVITGASSGIALASAKLFVEEGAYVFITGRRKDALNDAVELIGRNVTGVQADSANLADLDRLFESVKQAKGRIDVLFASAGMGEMVRLGEITEEHFDQTFGLNTRGTLFTVQKALPLFNDGGSIVLTSSVASIKGMPGMSVYAASKAALHSYARVWLNELKDRRIRVNVLSPGMVWTPTMEAMGTPEERNQLLGMIPRGEAGQPHELAPVALFLASDDSSYVNGQLLNVDGGTAAI
jgi:NAD(P)-dependent dehydrogenase (short-subunit alcohol dehydrogenase family)